MRLRLHKAVCLITVFVISIAFCVIPVSAQNNGIMASVYGYALNDYISNYGVVSTAVNNECFAMGDEAYMSPNGGIVYADFIKFNENDIPFMVIFLADKNKMCCEVHILRYDDEAKETELIGVISKPYDTIEENFCGEFNIGHFDGKSYISYKTYENHSLINSEYYTVIGNNAFMYVKSPEGISDIGIMDFNSRYFHSGMDLSNYNNTLGAFFKKLKDDTADSVTHEDISERLTLEEEEKLEDALSKAVNYCDFDISRFKSMAEYRVAMDNITNSDRFYLITNMYSLGEEIYYVRFSTDRSFYNYTLLRRSDSVENGYQLLKVRTDCIPLSDFELENIYNTYKRNTLLMKKTKIPLKLEKETKLDKPLFNFNLPKINIEKKLSESSKIPAALIGGGICLAILIAVWIILIKIYDDKK